MIVLWVVVLLMAFLLAGALRELGLVQLRLGDDPGALITDAGLERGTPAPDFHAVDAENGAKYTLSELPKRARVLVFVSPTCASCRHLIPHLNEVSHTRGNEYHFLVLCKGDRAACSAMARRNGLKTQMLVDESGHIESAYQVTMTPLTYLLDHQGRVVIRGIANDWRQLEALLDQEGTREMGAQFSLSLAGASQEKTMKEGRQ